MFLRLIKSVRRFANLFVLVHVLLAAFAPTLHAHSAQPLGHVGGFHAHFELEGRPSILCSDLGCTYPAFTIEVAEQRTVKNGEFVADAADLLARCLVLGSYPHPPTLAIASSSSAVSTPASIRAPEASAAKANALSCAYPPRPQAP